MDHYKYWIFIPDNSGWIITSEEGYNMVLSVFEDFEIDDTKVPPEWEGVKAAKIFAPS